jgi:hypothetical protein
LLLSLDKQGLGNKITIYCIDESSYNFFNDKNYNTELVDNIFKEKLGELSLWRSYEFNKIMFIKLSIIYLNLKKFEEVIFIDGDIFVREDFFSDLEKEKEKEKIDIIAQLDNDANSGSQVKTLCAGFMLIKSNKKTMEIFNPKKISFRKKRKNNFLFDDQNHINKNLEKINVKFLDPKKYPNGSYFYKHFKEINPLLIHFNWLKNDEKVEVMKKHNSWLVK